MSRWTGNFGKALTPRPGFKVEYGKPAEDTRFMPGQASNPKGRPKGAKNKRPGLHEKRMKDILLDEAYRGITVRDGDRNVTIPMAQAETRSMVVYAAKGQHRAKRHFAELLASAESSRKILHDQRPETAIEYKVEWENELRRSEHIGITDLPEPLPHSDHVKIDFLEGTAAVIGPATTEEKAEYDWFVERREMFEEDLRHLIDQRAEATDAKLIWQFDEEIARIQRSPEVINRRLPN